MTDLSPEALRRLALQQLEGWKRAGVTDLPLRASVQSMSASAVRDPASAVRDPHVQSTTAITTAAEPLSTAARTSQDAVLNTESDQQQEQAHVAPNETRSELTREERAQKLADLQHCVAGCTRCAELASTRTQTVFGVGDPTATILFVGEAPGADEDRQGEPFVGRAGQLLNRIIEASQLTRDELYICNILRCRPPGNRNPTTVEAQNCREYLDGQIAIVDPDYIVCWGTVAAQNLLDTTQTIGKLRGRFLKYGRAKVLCTYHPSYLLRNPAAKKQVWEDMKRLRGDMGVEL